jgi:hypothetical protein
MFDKPTTDSAKTGKQTGKQETLQGASTCRLKETGEGGVDGLDLVALKRSRAPLAKHACSTSLARVLQVAKA